MDKYRLQFNSLYLTRFSTSFGKVALVTLLPSFIDLFNPSGAVIGLFTTALTLGQTITVVPLGWAGDRFDKRNVLLGALGINIAAYLLFAGVDSSADFIAARGLQGIGLLAAGLVSLALIGELAPQDRKAHYIGKFNSWRFAAGVAGTLGAGALYELFGFDFIFFLLAGLLVAAFVGVWRYVDPDETTVRGFAFKDLAVNRRILTLATFRGPYAFAVTLIRNWAPIYVGVSLAKGGLGYSAFIVGLVIAAEKFTNMLCQPFTGQLSDTYGRARFIFVGGGLYGLIALVIPFAPTMGAAAGLPGSFPLVGELSSAFIPILLLNGLLGAADSMREPASMALFADEGRGEGITSSFGIRSLIWRPGNVAAPMAGGLLMTGVGMEWVFFVGGLTAVLGAVAFYAVLSFIHGRRALVKW